MLNHSIESLRRLVAIAVFAIVGVLTACRAQNTNAQQHTHGPSPITVDSSEDQIRRAVSNARMGRKLTPKTWPKGARVAVCLTFDVDNELLQRNIPLPVPLSVGE